MQSSVGMTDAFILSAVGRLCNVKTEAVTMIRTIVYNGHFTYHVEKGLAGEQEMSVYKIKYYCRSKDERDGCSVYGSGDVVGKNVKKQMSVRKT